MIALGHRKAHPRLFGGVLFDSGKEARAMEILCEGFGITPIEGVNCHIRMGDTKKTVDFRPAENLFIEYHPRDWNLTHEQYYDQRRKLLDENGFQKCRLVIAKSLNDVKRQLKFLKGA